MDSTHKTWTLKQTAKSVDSTNFNFKEIELVVSIYLIRVPLDIGNTYPSGLLAQTRSQRFMAHLNFLTSLSLFLNRHPW